MSDIALLISGVSRGFAPNSMQITETLGQRATANFTIRDEPGSYVPGVGEPVDIYDETGIKRFGGTIQDVTARKPYNPGVFREEDIVCTDYTQTADRRNAGEYEWSNAYANDIVRDIVTNSLDGEGIGLTYVPAGGGPLVVSFKTTYPTVADALTELATLAGRIWRIDYEKEMRWIDPSLVSPAWTLDNTSGNAIMGTPSVRTTREQYANRVIVRFGAYLQEGLTDTLAGDGTTTIFQLVSPIAATPIVSVDGVGQTIGVVNVDTGKDVYWSDNSQYLTFTTAPGSGAVINISYTGRIMATIVSQNNTEVDARKAVEGGTGVYVARYEVNSTYTAADAQAYADALVAKLSQLSTVLTFDTDVDHPFTGERYTVDLDRLATGTFLVRQVRTFDLDGLYFRRTVEAVAGPILLDVVDSFKGLTGKGAGSGVAFSTTSLGAVYPGV